MCIDIGYRSSCAAVYNRIVMLVYDVTRFGVKKCALVNTGIDSIKCSIPFLTEHERSSTPLQRRKGMVCIYIVI